MSCCKCIEVDTPQSIMDDGSLDGEYPAETDIFEEVMDTATGEWENAAVMGLMLWFRFRYEGIGSCNAKRWVQAMADRVDIVGAKWDNILTLWQSGDIDLTNMDEMDYERIVQRTAMPDTVGTVRTVGHTGNDVTVMGNETLPQSPVDGYNYLDNKTTSTRTNGQTDTDTYIPNEQDREVYKEERDLAAATFSRMIRENPLVVDMFCDEFRGYFLGRWRACRHTRRPGSTGSPVRCHRASTRSSRRART